jgi:hypothetical protein
MNIRPVKSQATFGATAKKMAPSNEALSPRSINMRRPT